MCIRDSPVRSYKGHSHIVQDVVVSADGNYAVSASWDKTLRLWNLATGNSEARFVGHTGDVLSVAIDANSSKIISASRDKTIRVWNTVGDCAYVLLGHTDWVTKVRVAPKNLEDGEVDDGRITFVSAGMDKIVRVCARLFSFIALHCIAYLPIRLIYLGIQVLSCFPVIYSQNTWLNSLYYDK